MNLVLILCWIMKHVEALAVLLQGLCGSHRQVMKVHELCLKSGPNLGLSTKQLITCVCLYLRMYYDTNVLFAGQGSSEVHVLCDLSENDPLWYITIF